MKDISEFGPGTSAYEVLVHLLDRIITGELRTFQALKAYARVIAENPHGKPILRKAFDLQRRLYWGFFSDLNPEHFRAVWGQVVMPDADFDFAGDLKGYMSIPDVFIGLLDIHGYTRYCHENRKNMSMLDRLDRMIHEDVRAIAARNGILSRRSRGDEILLLGASAGDLADTVLQIMGFFSKRRRIQENAKEGGVAYDIFLPPFEVSSGLAGGQKYTPLVITREGDLSGDIVNTAARLQARANKLSPHRNRLLLTSHVHQRITSGPRKKGAGSAKLRFLNTGTIEFKGVSLTVYDAILAEAETWRLEIQGELEELYGSMDRAMWRSKVFEDALKLAARMAMSMPEFSVPRGNSDSGDLGASLFLGLIRSAKEDFTKESFETALATFSQIVADLSLVEGVDEVALEYLKAVDEGYQAILSSFIESLDGEIGTHPDAVFGPTEKGNFETLKKHAAMYGRLVDKARLGVRSRKSTWFRVADLAAPVIGARIESRK